MTTAKVQLRHPLEYKAFAKFCDEMADIQPTVEAYFEDRYGRVRSVDTAEANQASEAEPLPTAGPDEPEGQTDEPKPTRERGQPSPGRKRRTKEEIAEDEAAAVAGTVEVSDEADPAGRIEAAQANISASPEDRVDPEAEADAEQDAADEAEADAEQDAADEAAEAAETKTEAYTLDDVRKVIGQYANKYGMEFAQADGPELIARVMGKKHDAAAPLKISDLGDDQALIKRAIDGANEMLVKNPFARIEKKAND